MLNTYFNTPFGEQNVAGSEIQLDIGCSRRNPRNNAPIRVTQFTPSDSEPAPRCAH